MSECTQRPRAITESGFHNLPWISWDHIHPPEKMR